MDVEMKIKEPIIRLQENKKKKTTVSIRVLSFLHYLQSWQFY